MALPFAKNAVPTLLETHQIGKRVVWSGVPNALHIDEHRLGKVIGRQEDDRKKKRHDKGTDAIHDADPWWAIGEGRRAF